MRQILLTGGTRGIGRALLDTLISDGFFVHVLAQNQQSLDKLKCAYGAIETHCVNLANSSEVSDFAKSFDHRLYAIVHNAGTCQTANIGSKESSNVWKSVLQVNLSSIFEITDALIAKVESPGRVIVISSQLGHEGRRGYGAYCATKFALIGLTRTWAKELGPRQITVNAICPGWVETEMTVKDIERLAKKDQTTYQRIYSEVCEPLELRRMNTPCEIANFASFLLSSRASGISGRDFLLQTVWNQL